MRPLFRSSLLVLLFAVSLPAIAQHSILFLGNSITYDGRFIADVETWHMFKFPSEQAEFINVGLPSETVSGLSEEGHAGGKFPRPDLHERLARVLAAVKPELVIVDYGMNDGIYLPLDSVRFMAYRNGMTWLYDELKKAGIPAIVFCTPPVHDDPVKGSMGYDLVLDEYSRWLMTQGKEKGWEVIDIHFPMKAYLEGMRAKDPKFKLAEDGVHPGDLGHWLMAREIIAYLGTAAPEASSVIGALGSSQKAVQVRALVDQRQHIMKDAWLRRTGFIRPGMPEGLPFEEAEKKAKAITEEIGKLMAESDK